MREQLKWSLVTWSTQQGFASITMANGDRVEVETPAYSIRAIARMKGTKRKTISYIKRLGIEAGLLEAVRHKRQVMLRLTMRAITACEEVAASIERVS